MDQFNKKNLNNVFSKLDTSELIIAYYATFDYSWDENNIKRRNYDRESEGDYVDINVDITVQPANKVVLVPFEEEYSYWYGVRTETKYYDLRTGKEVVLDKDLDTSYTKGEFLDFFKRIPSKCILPMSFSEHVKEKLGIDVPKEMSIQKIIKLLNKINSLEKNKNSFVLSSNKSEAKKQLSKFLGLKTNSVYDDDEILETIETIEKLRLGHEEVYDKSVKKKLDNAINEYYNDLEKEKPTLEFFDPNKEITLELTSSPKQKLINKLNKIYNSLIDEIALMNYLEELYECQKILENDNHQENNSSSLITNIRELKNNLNYVPNKEKYINIIKEKIQNEIIERKKELEDQLGKTDDEIKYHTTTQSKKLKDDIIEIKEIVEKISDKYKPLIEVKTALSNTNDKEYKQGNTLSDIIESIDFIFTKIENTKYNDDLKAKWKKLKEEYTAKINDLISNENLVTKENFKEMEISLRKEVEQILKELSFSNNKSINQIITPGSLLYQLEESKKLVEESLKKSELKDFNKKEPITSQCADVISFLLSDKKLQNEKERTKSQLMDIINKYEIIINKMTINNYEAYDEVRRAILAELASAKASLNVFLEKANKNDEQTININRGRK